MASLVFGLADLFLQQLFAELLFGDVFELDDGVIRGFHVDARQQRNVDVAALNRATLDKNVLIKALGVIFMSGRSSWMLNFFKKNSTLVFTLCVKSWYVFSLSSTLMALKLK